MTKRVQIVGHVKTAADLFSGLSREVTVDTTTNALRVHDGSTIGGHEVAKADATNIAGATNATKGAMTAVQVTEHEQTLLDVVELFKHVRGNVAIDVAGAVDVIASVAQAENNVIELTGAITANIEVVFPNEAFIVSFINSTTGAFTVKCRLAGMGDGTGVILLRGQATIIISDAATVYDPMFYDNTGTAITAATIAGALTELDADLTTHLGATNPHSITAGGLGALVAANNLSDLVSATTARTNLGLGDLAVETVAKIQNQSFTSAVDTGAVNAYVVELVPAVTAYVDGQKFIFESGITNTGDSTFKANGLAVIPIQKGNGENVAAGELVAGKPLAVIIGGVGVSTFAQLVNPPRTMQLNDIQGLKLTNNVTDATNDLDIAIGKARSSDDDADLVLSAGVTRQLDQAFGTGNGGLSSTLTKAPNTFYYVILCKNSAGVVTVGFDTSETATNLITDHSITNPRSIGEIRTDAVAAPNSVIRPFFQKYDKFMLKVPVLATVINNLGARQLSTLLVPPDNQLAIINVRALTSSTKFVIYICSPDATDVSIAVLTNAPLGTMFSETTTPGSYARLEMETDASGRIALKSNNIDNVWIATLGWISNRGRR